MKPPFWRTIAPPYIHRQYRTRDQMRMPWVWAGDFDGAGHIEGGYCLDRVDTEPQYAYEGDFSKPRPASDFWGCGS